MSRIEDIIDEEIMTTVANHAGFGDRLNSISETDEEDDSEIEED